MVPSRVKSLRQRFASQAPAEWARVTNNGPFRVVIPFIDLGFTDEGLYLGRIRQTYLHGRPYGPWLGSRALKSWIFDCLSFYQLAAFIWVSGGDFNLGWTLAHAFFGSCWFLMFYSLYRKYSEEEACALMFAAFSFFFLDTLNQGFFTLFHLFGDPASVVARLKSLPSTVFTPIAIFMRLPSPGMAFLWLSAGLAGALTLSFSSKRRPLAAAVFGAACGLLCLVHFFEWVLAVVTLYIFAAAVWTEKDTPASGRFNLALTAGVAAAISGAYFIFARTLTGEGMHDVISMSGEWGRHFSLLSLSFLLFALICWGVAGRRQGLRRRIWVLAAAFQAAAFVVANLPLVLGYDMQFDRHVAYHAAIGGILIVPCWILDQENLKTRFRPHALILTAFICAWFGFKAKTWADTHFKLYGIPKDFAAAAEWMNANVPKDSMLLAISIPATHLLPLEAEMRMPVTFACIACGEPFRTEDNLRGFALIMKTLDVAPDRFRDERWRQRGEAELDMTHRAEDLTGNLDWEFRERSVWPYFLIGQMRLDPRTLEDKWTEIARYAEEAEPLRAPFYAWIQKGDEPFLRRSPVESGGKLIYQNPTVSLYSFPNGALTAPRKRAGR